MARKGENIRKRADGRWEARYIKGYDPDGKTKLGYVYAHSYSEVKEKRQKILGENKRFTNDKTVSEIIEAFLIYKQNKVKYSTYIHYRNIIETHISPYFKNRSARKLTIALIDEFSNFLLSDGNFHGGGLSPKSVKDILSILRQILKYGQQNGLVNEEILRFEVPRVPTASIETFTEEEQNTIEEHCLMDFCPYKAGILLCLYTGMRIGEICALKWSDIDFGKSIIMINKTMQRIQTVNDASKTEIHIDEPKTVSSIREIPIPYDMVDNLLEQRLKAVTDNAYIITGTENFLEPRTYYEKYKTFLKECGILPHSFHCLRHTFATRSIEKGFDAKTLSEILGHSDVRVTLNRYVHPSLERKRDCMNLLKKKN